MTDLRTAAQQALEALWYYRATEWGADSPAGKAIHVLQAALAQEQAEQTWVCPDSPEHRYAKPGHCEDCGKTLAQEQAEPVQEPMQESALQAVAEKIGDQCAVWYGIGARDVEEVLREAVRYGLVRAAQAESPCACWPGRLCSRQAQCAADVRKQQAEPVQEQAEPDAYGYASYLAVAIWEKHYKDTAPNWKPLDDLMGVLTQIDNMVAGMTRLAQEQAVPVQEQDVELSAALGWPGGLSNPVLDRKVLLQKVAALMQDKLWEDHRVRHLWDHTLAQQAEPVQEPMARDDIIRMAREAQQEQLSLDGRSPSTALRGYWLTMEVADLARFAALAADRLARHGIPMLGDEK